MTKKNYQKEALEIICKTKNGAMRDLQELIGVKMVEEFELVGFIKKGMKPNAEETWEVIDYAQKFKDSIYGKPNFMERVGGYVTAIFA